jgi:hypothetical protein
VYEFKGRTLTQEASAVTLTFESRSSVPLFSKTSARTFHLVADGNSINRATLPLDKSTLIGYITWEQSSLQLSISDFHKFLTATRIAAFSLGHITYSFTTAEFAALKDFAEALRLGDSVEWRTPQKACSLLTDMGLQTSEYKSYQPGEYKCASPYNAVTTGSVNIVFQGLGDQYSVKELQLIMYANSNDKRTHDDLVVASGVLANRSLGVKLPDMLLLYLLVGKPYKWALGKNQLEVSRAAKATGYEVKFIIR